jgi:hypothetical protein
MLADNPRKNAGGWFAYRLTKPCSAPCAETNHAAIRLAIVGRAGFVRTKFKTCLGVCR